MGFNQQNGDFNGMYSLVIYNIAIENCPFRVWWFLHSYVSLQKRVIIYVDTININ